MRRLNFLFLGSFLVAASLSATTINFEGLADSTVLTTQYSGVSFSNAIILTSGISLNEFEFPPHSGINVVSDNNGPMSIAFSSPITSFSGFFTYTDPLTITAYSASNTLLRTVSSAYSANEAISGVAGSSPNELLQISSLAGISTITISGDPAGGSFVLDDVSYINAVIPEPSFSVVMPFVLLIGFAVISKLKAAEPPLAK